MERNDIIKALECCAEDTPYPDQSQALLDAITLIKQLTEENEKLKERADRHLDNLKAVLDERAEENVVEVVRCKDCKHFGKDLGYGKHDCKKYEMPYCLENDYCSYGERKE